MAQYITAAVVSCRENQAETPREYPRCSETSRARANDGDVHCVKLRIVSIGPMRY
jgi:hypothetical protein